MGPCPGPDQARWPHGRGAEGRRVRHHSLGTGLRTALDETRGTIEIADEGPFLINDFRVSGDNRILRARPGYRAIIRIERPTLEAVWSQPAVIELKGKNLTLDSLDLILDVSRLPSSQTSLFSCVGSNLTVSNCTITLVNAGNQAFSLVRAEGSPARGSQIRFENTLIRGAMTSGFDLAKGSVDVAVRSSVFLGSQGAIARRGGGRPRGESSVLRAR